MGRVLQRVAAVAAVALAGTALTLSSTPASADHATCVPPTTHDMRESVSGTLTAANNLDYWLSTSSEISRTFTLAVGAGDATLRILDSSCLLILCESNTTGSATETCTTSVPGPLQIEVEWVSGVVPYTLSASATPITSNVPVVFATGYPSDDCDAGTDLFTGRFGTPVTPGFTKVRTTSSGGDTVVCVRADTDTPARFGGKLVVDHGSLPGVPTTDDDADSCGVASGGNDVPVGDGFVDVHATGSELWLCLSDGTNDVRVIVPTGSTPTATFYVDQAAGGRHFEPTPAGEPTSGSCIGEVGSVAIADVQSSGHRSYVYLVRNFTGTKICVNVAGYGGILHVREGIAGIAPVVTTGNTCSSTLFTYGNHTLSGGISTTTANLCFTAASQTVSVSVNHSADLNRVSWTPDPGTPDFF